MDADRHVVDLAVVEAAFVALEHLEGLLLASGFIAGEALMGVALSGLVLVGLPSVTKMITGRDELGLLHTGGGWLSILVFACVAYILIRIPIRSAEKGEGVSVRLE